MANELQGWDFIFMHLSLNKTYEITIYEIFTDTEIKEITREKIIIAHFNLFLDWIRRPL